jgi:hypothetical protein
MTHAGTDADTGFHRTVPFSQPVSDEGVEQGCNVDVVGELGAEVAVGDWQRFCVDTALSRRM